MARILVIEDDPGMGQLLCTLAREEKHDPVLAESLADADDALKEQKFDLITLDVNLPDGKGIEYCARLRARGVRTPIIMVTTEVAPESVIAGLQAGADDYLRKPIQKPELQARLRAHLRRVVDAARSLEFKGLSADLETRAVRYDGREIALTGRQYDLLVILLRRPEVVFSRDQIIEALGRDSEIYDRTIDSHLSQLRKRLSEGGVKTVSISSVYGAGYRLE